MTNVFKNTSWTFSRVSFEWHWIELNAVRARRFVNISRYNLRRQFCFKILVLRHCLLRVLWMAGGCEHPRENKSWYERHRRRRRRSWGNKTGKQQSSMFCSKMRLRCIMRAALLTISKLSHLLDNGTTLIYFFLSLWPWPSAFSLSPADTARLSLLFSYTKLPRIRSVLPTIAHEIFSKINTSLTFV